jgi:integrase
VLENKEIEGSSSAWSTVTIERGGLDPWILYLYAMKSPATKEKYLMRLGKFLNFLNLQKEGTLEDKSRAFAEKGRNDNVWAFNSILKFIQLLKERVDRKEITAGTIRNYVKSIKLFCQMADILIPWDKITRGIPKGRRYADDRAPTLDEIKKMCEYPDRRIKPLIYTMVSSGIRVGAWDYLHWGNIQPIEQEGKTIAARMLIYAGEDDSYITYITPSAYRELAEWMKYREESGEIITDNSWVMRDLWDTRVKISKGLVTIPKKLTAIGVKRLMERAIWAQGLRKKLEAGKKRHPFATNHSLRKYFKTRCELEGMKPINIENLIGHSTGISDCYFRPTLNDLLQDYLKCVDALTINDEKTLQKKVEELANKSEDNQYLVNAKMYEKEKQIEILLRKQEKFEVLIQSLIDTGQLKPTNIKE